MHQQNCEIQTTISEYTGCEYPRRPSWFTFWTLLHVWAPGNPSSRCESSAGRLPARTAQALLHCCSWSISAAPLSAVIILRDSLLHSTVYSPSLKKIATPIPQRCSGILTWVFLKWPQCKAGAKTATSLQALAPLFYVDEATLMPDLVGRILAPLTHTKTHTSFLCAFIQTTSTSQRSAPTLEHSLHMAKKTDRQKG